jgi:3-oxoadipate enol-lactonase
MRIKLNGILADYKLEGEAGKPAVVLVHGFPFSKEMWKAQAEALKKDYQVLAYDLRGMGQSSLGKAPQLLEAYVDDLFALLDFLKLKKAALAGLSMGGYIALRAMQRDPERFRALLLCDTRSDPDSDEGKLKRAAGIAAIRQKGADAFSRAMLPNLLQDQGAKAAGLLRLMLGNKADGMANALAAMAARSDCSASLKEIRVPALVVVGSEDKITPPALAEGMAKAIPGARLAVIPGAGHVSNFDKPAEFNRLMLEFLGGLA